MRKANTKQTVHSKKAKKLDKHNMKGILIMLYSMLVVSHPPDLPSLFD
jgi:hypothetical protein